MSRAVMIAAGGDVFICATVVELLRRYCWSEFDSLYICYNNFTETPKEVQAELISRYLDDPKIKIIYWPTAIGYGLPITKMLRVAEEDLVLLLEDDGFIFTPGVIDRHFKMIESDQYAALGSPRFSCGAEIAEALKQKYNLDYSGYGDVGPNFWPNFFFCRKRDMLDTDMNFAPKEFTKGVYYPELDHTMSETEYGDTFVWTCIQMRYRGVKFGDIPQFHASPTEKEDKEAKTMNWVKDTPFWMHGGSLSVGAGKYLNGVLPDVSNDNAKWEIETRAAFWMLCSNYVKGFSAYKKVYTAGIEHLIEGAQLSRDRILNKYLIYKELLKI